jgi:AcrR family transcriptional regulator
VVDHEQRRTEIVHALWAVINDCGIEGVTFQAVAQAAGVSVGRLQHYFASKEALVLEGCRAIVTSAAAAYFARATATDPWPALRDLLVQPIPGTESFRLGAAVWYAYLARAIVDPGIGEIVADATRGTVDQVASLLDEVGLGAEDHPNLALRLVSLSNGLSQRALLGVTSAPAAVAVVDEELARLRG